MCRRYKARLLLPRQHTDQIRERVTMSEQQPTKMWSGRFREPLDPTFESWQRSFPFDWRLVPYEVEASIAHARAIQSAGILTSEELLQMEEGLRAVAKQQAEQGEAIVTANPQAEDVHHYVELELTKQIDLFGEFEFDVVVDVFGLGVGGDDGLALFGLLFGYGAEA